MRNAISAIVIKDGKLLVVKKNKTWILPGGKPELGETDLGCLCREIQEELPGVKLVKSKYYGNFQGQAPHKRDVLNARAYFAEVIGEPSRVGEGDTISDFAWVNNFQEYNLSNITSKIVNSLRQGHYL